MSAHYVSRYTQWLATMKHLDHQLAVFRDRLRSDVGLTEDEAGKVATIVAADIRFLAVEAKAEIKSASLIPLSARLEELVAFQSWSDFATSVKSNPAITRASVVVQNYICFVYLKDACFEVVAKHAAAGSVAARASAYLSRGTVRDFRNAFSHANWRYNKSFSGLECWVLEDSRNRSGPIRHFEVSQDDLNFWQALSRGVAYATYTQLRAGDERAGDEGQVLYRVTSRCCYGRRLCRETHKVCHGL